MPRREGGDPWLLPVAGGIDVVRRASVTMRGDSTEIFACGVSRYREPPEGDAAAEDIGV